MTKLFLHVKLVDFLPKLSIKFYNIKAAKSQLLSYPK